MTQPVMNPENYQNITDLCGAFKGSVPTGVGGRILLKALWVTAGFLMVSGGLGELPVADACQLHREEGEEGELEHTTEPDDTADSHAHSHNHPHPILYQQQHGHDHQTSSCTFPGTPLATTASDAVPSGKLNPNPVFNFVLDSGFGWFSTDERTRQGGHAIDENGFSLQALEMGVAGTVDRFFRFDMFLQLTHLHLEEAFLTTLALPANLQARAGYFHVAFGRHNPRHLHSWNFVNPPLVQTRFMAEEHFSGAGAEISAVLPLPWSSRIIAEAFTSSDASELNSSTFGTVEMNSSGILDGVEDFLYVARLENLFNLTSNWSLMAGASGALGLSPFAPDKQAALFGGDLYLKWRPMGHGDHFVMALTVEGMLRETQVPLDRVRDWGGYVQLDLQLSQRWMAGLRGDYTRMVGDGDFPYDTDLHTELNLELDSHLDHDHHVAGGWPHSQERASLSLTYMPTHFSKIRLQGDLFDVDMSHQSPDFGVFMQVELSAGAHGNHSL